MRLNEYIFCWGWDSTNTSSVGGGWLEHDINLLFICLKVTKGKLFDIIEKFYLGTQINKGTDIVAT